MIQIIHRGWFHLHLWCLLFLTVLSLNWLTLSPNSHSRQFFFSLLSDTFPGSLISTVNTTYFSRVGGTLFFKAPCYQHTTLQHSNVLLCVYGSDGQIIETQQLTLLISSDFLCKTQKFLQSIPVCSSMSLRKAFNLDLEISVMKNIQQLLVNCSKG